MAPSARTIAVLDAAWQSIRSGAVQKVAGIG